MTGLAWPDLTLPDSLLSSLRVNRSSSSGRLACLLSLLGRLSDLLVGRFGDGLLRDSIQGELGLSGLRFGRLAGSGDRSVGLVC